MTKSRYMFNLNRIERLEKLGLNRDQEKGSRTRVSPYQHDIRARHRTEEILRP